MVRNCVTLEWFRYASGRGETEADACTLKTMNAAFASRRAGDAHGKRPWPVGAALLVWRELIWPCRRTWAGMAAVWLLLLGINRALMDRQETTRRVKSVSAASASLQAIEEQRRLLEELISSSGGRGISIRGWWCI